MGAIETFSAADATPVELPRKRGADAPSAIEPERIERLLERSEPMGHWPTPIRALYESEVVARLAREQHFLFLFGLLVCLATILVDMAVAPEMVKEGAVLRVLAVAPLTLIGLFASARRWNNVAAFCVGAAPVAFAVVIVHLALHLPPHASARYLAAAALLMGFANMILPFTLRGLVVFDIAYIAAAFAVNVWSFSGDPAQNLGYFVLLVIISGATLFVAHRLEALRQNNFLLNLRARITSEELLAANERLQALSDRDPLTGLANRRCFEREFDEMVEREICGGARRGSTPCQIAVLMIDLDHFKAFNDTHGHQAGDECLRIIGHELSAALQHVGGIVARYGGEEFVGAVCEDTPGDIARAAEDIRRTIASQPIPVGGPGRSLVTGSIGVALAPLEGEICRDALIKTADAALYAAKRSGRNRVETIAIDEAAALRA